MFLGYIAIVLKRGKTRFNQNFALVWITFLFVASITVGEIIFTSRGPSTSVLAGLVAGQRASGDEEA